MNDAELIQRVRGGNVELYGELVQRYQDRALVAAYAILGDRHEAEDATQEAFTRAFLALHRFRPGASFRAWLQRIVLNEAYDLYAARQHRADLLSRVAVPPEALSPTRSAEAEALGDCGREEFLEALVELRTADQRVITCRYFLDLSEAETATVLGVARGTIKSRLSRALERLAPRVRELEAGPERL